MSGLQPAVVLVCHGDFRCEPSNWGMVISQCSSYNSVKLAWVGISSKLNGGTAVTFNFDQVDGMVARITGRTAVSKVHGRAGGIFSWLLINKLLWQGRKTKFEPTLRLCRARLTSGVEMYELSGLLTMAKVVRVSWVMMTSSDGSGRHCKEQSLFRV